MRIPDSLLNLGDKIATAFTRLAARLNNRSELDEVALEPKEIQNFNQLYLLKYKYQLLVAAGFGLLCFLLLYFMLLSAKAGSLTELKVQEFKLRASYAEGTEKIAEIPILEQDIAQIKSHSSAILIKLPKDFLEADIVQQFYMTGLKNDLKISVTKRLEPRINTSFIVRPYEIQTTGTYAQIKQFCYEIGKINLLIVLSNLSLSAANDKGGEVINQEAVNHEKLKLKIIAYTYEVNLAALGGDDKDNEKNH